MVKPQKVLLQCRPGNEMRPGTCAIYMSDTEFMYAVDGGPVRLFGRCDEEWKDLSDQEIYQALTLAVLDMVEFCRVPIRFARDCLADNVEGYREWSNSIGALGR